ncbi:hypothetical protein EV421DRAFT_1735549 [Armillaria borealis]|uniref:Uncharacterized protein n=1 Tax=Armillaria borealis TaxID=47425 RepID=A0AA39MRY7_9AGAR|nr:hypothetical protein EV421DRAFT_1735549 [Armillaria borealis]
MRVEEHCTGVNKNHVDKKLRVLRRAERQGLRGDNQALEAAAGFPATRHWQNDESWNFASWTGTNSGCTSPRAYSPSLFTTTTDQYYALRTSPWNISQDLRYIWSFQSVRGGHVLGLRVKSALHRSRAQIVWLANDFEEKSVSMTKAQKGDTDVNIEISEASGSPADSIVRTAIYASIMPASTTTNTHTLSAMISTYKYDGSSVTVEHLQKVTAFCEDLHCDKNLPWAASGKHPWKSGPHSEELKRTSNPGPSKFRTTRLVWPLLNRLLLCSTKLRHSHPRHLHEFFYVTTACLTVCRLPEDQSKDVEEPDVIGKLHTRPFLIGTLRRYTHHTNGIPCQHRLVNGSVMNHMAISVRQYNANTDRCGRHVCLLEEEPEVLRLIWHPGLGMNSGISVYQADMYDGRYLSTPSYDIGRTRKLRKERSLDSDLRNDDVARRREGKNSRNVTIDSLHNDLVSDLKHTAGHVSLLQVGLLQLPFFRENPSHTALEPSQALARSSYHMCSRTGFGSLAALSRSLMPPARGEGGSIEEEQMENAHLASLYQPSSGGWLFIAYKTRNLQQLPRRHDQSSAASCS